MVSLGHAVYFEKHFQITKYQGILCQIMEYHVLNVKIVVDIWPVKINGNIFHSILGLYLVF